MLTFVRRSATTAVFGTALVLSAFVFHKASAQPGEFSLQISPSPLVSTLKPGQATTLELKVRNAGDQAENLKIAPRTFKITSDQQLQIDDTQTPEVAPWIRFSAPTFTIKPGDTFTQHVTINVPKEAGFSYSFALVISRTANAGTCPDQPRRPARRAVPAQNGPDINDAAHAAQAGGRNPCGISQDFH